MEEGRSFSVAKVELGDRLSALLVILDKLSFCV